MSVYDNPAVEALAKALGDTPRDIRQNFDLLVHGGLRHYTDSAVLKYGFDVCAALDPEARAKHAGELPSQLFSLYRKAVSACRPWSDVLGAVHALTLARTGGEGLGQFFTPEDLADLAAALELDHWKRHPRKASQGLMKVHEPAVGSGGLLLGRFRAGSDPSQCVLDAWDLDPLCCAMTALQMCANVVEWGQPIRAIVVRQGNTLTQKHKIFWMAIHHGSDLAKTIVSTKLPEERACA